MEWGNGTTWIQDQFVHFSDGFGNKGGPPTEYRVPTTEYRVPSTEYQFNGQKEHPETKALP